MARRLRLLPSLPSLRSLGRLQGRLVLMMVFALFTIVTADSLNVWSARSHALAAAQKQTAMLSRSLAEQAHSVFQTLDTILLGMRERAETDGFGPTALDRLHRLLAMRMDALPLLHRLSVVDAQGRVVSTSGAGSDKGRGIADQLAFRHHLATADRGLFLGWPVQDPGDGEWVIPMSRRIDHADGSFAGIVVASVATRHFFQAYASLDAGPHSLILIARADGLVMARWPADQRAEAQNVSRGKLFSRTLKSADEASFMGASLVDGVVRLASFHRVANLPAVIEIARSKDDVLATWREIAEVHGVILTIVLIAIAVLARRLASRIGEEERSTAALQDAHGRLARSEADTAQANRWLEMAEQVAQVGHWNLAIGEVAALTWSDEVYRIHGLDPHHFTLTLENAIQAYHPQDQVVVADAVQAVLKEGMPFECTSRLLRPDGSMRHVLSRALPQIDPHGAITGVFGVFMDITNQKLAEAALLAAHAEAEASNQALEAANHALEELALQDALTGLANRRHFDRALELEFRRALRSATSLALLLIDVDQFKAYNDLYGHPAGDTCLRAIADVIPPLLQRPGDTAARYGGEEMVALLPGNTEGGALALAYRIASAVRALAIAHAGSPHGVVTISVGVEAFVPVREQDTEAALVEHADMALYAAKRGGRDCVMTYSDAKIVARPSDALTLTG